MSAPAIFGGIPKSFAASPTAVAARIIAASSTNRTRSGGGIIIKATAANTQIVYIGGSNVDATVGFPLSAGEAVSLAVDDPSVVWAISASGTQNLRVLYI